MLQLPRPRSRSDDDVDLGQGKTSNPRYSVSVAERPAPAAPVDSGPSDFAEGDFGEGDFGEGDSGGVDSAPVGRADPQRRKAWLVTGVAVAGFGLARLLDLVFLRQAVARHPGATLGGYLTAWDGGWYRLVAGHGYPHELVRAHNGYLVKSALAFFPAYPGLVRGLQDVTHLPFAGAGVALNLVLGAAAAAVIAAVLRPRLGPAVAATASVFWSFLPVSPVLMMTYTEALFSLELAGILWLLLRRRYVWLALLLPVAGLSRGALLPLAAVLLVHLAVRLREVPVGDGGRPARLRVTAAVGGLLVVLLASFALWPAWVAHRTGQRDAYLQIQRAWIRNKGTYSSWGQAVGLLRDHDFASPSHGLVAAVGLTLLALALLALLTPMPAELKALAPSYLLFFVLAFPAWTPFFRYMLPVFSLAAVPAMVVRARWWPVRVVVVALVLAGCVTGQHWWIDHFAVRVPGSLTP